MDEARSPTRYRPILSWLLGVAVGCVVVALPLAVATLFADDDPMIQVATTDSSISGVLSSGSHRVLFTNTWSPAEARSFYGRVTGPWDQQANTLIAPGTDRAAPGVLELLERAQPEQLIVIGVPGADPTWAHIERWCRANAMDVHWVADFVQFRAGELTVSAIASGETAFGFLDLVIEGPSGIVVVELGPDASGLDSDILVTSLNRTVLNSRLVVRESIEEVAGLPVVAMSPGDVVEMSLAGDEVLVSGGNLVRSGSR